jgi:hypothetical protein
MSQVLAAYAAAAEGTLTSIDPTPKPAFLDWVAGHKNVRHIAAPSLDSIASVGAIDAWFVDGDHNYFTVLNELRAIDALGRAQLRPLLVFLHDVSWPAARRDMYYAPDRIPPEHRHSFNYDSGAFLDRDALVHGQGFRGHAQFAMATHSGGPGNGVLTAVEDFIATCGGAGRTLAWAHVPAVFGLGVLFDIDAPWSAAVAQALAPFHDNPLLATLEINRLRNYLKVIELQDAASGA